MRVYAFRKSSVAIVFCVLMILMTQTGYLDNLNPWSGNQETLDQITEAMETGGSSSSNSNLTASVEGADLFIDEAMTNITFLYDDGAASGSGSGGSVSSTCVGTACMVKDINASGNGVFNPLYTVGNTIYFRGADGTNGMELWKSDGTTSGTMMVKDIWSGSNGGHLWNGSLVG